MNWLPHLSLYETLLVRQEEALVRWNVLLILYHAHSFVYSG
jgi:hypothetical protein